MTGSASLPVEMSVVAPCFNEEENLKELVVRLRVAFDQIGIIGEIVLVNDGSRDGTAAVVERLSALYPEVRGCHHEFNRGIEAAWNTGIRASVGVLVAFIDADLQNQPEDLAHLLNIYRSNSVDIVQGSRVPVTRGPRSRYVLSRGLNSLLNLVYGMRLRDNKSGFILGSRETLAKTLLHRYRYRYFQTLLLVSAHSKGFRIAEVDTLFANRTRGTSFMGAIPVRVIVGSLFDVLKGIIEFRILKRRESAVLET